MKRIFTLLFSASLAVPAFSQADILDFESLNLPLDSFWNGSDLTGEYVEFLGSNQDEAFRAKNTYNTGFDYFENGYAVSTMRDDTTAGFANQYGCIAGGGYNSDAFGLVSAYSEATLHLDLQRFYGSVFTGVYLTNSTWAYFSMQDGDGFAKQFGGVTGTDPDYFFARFYFYYDTLSNIPNDSVDFYLADFRSDNSAEDYILDDWVFFDLNDYPNFEYGGYKMGVKLFSSDTNSLGILTPAFFCMDDLGVDYPSSIGEQPEEEAFTVRVMQESFLVQADQPSDFVLYNLQGQQLDRKENQFSTSFDSRQLPQGVYIIEYQNGSERSSQKLWRW